MADEQAPSEEAPVYRKVAQAESRSFFLIECDEGWK